MQRRAAPGAGSRLQPQIRGASFRAVMRTTSLNSGWQFAAPSWLDSNGKGVKLGFSSLEWLPAEGARNVHLDLIRHGIIADPFAGRGELGCQWVDETPWSFKKSLRFTRDPALPRQVL